MGLFDHLFKSKSPSSEEGSVEPGAKPAEPAKPADAAARGASHRADPSAFLHPKSFVPRGISPLATPAKSGAASGVRKLGAPAAPPAAEEIVLSLGDVLSRIPTPYLKMGEHDPKRELRFSINDLSSDIARGRAAVPLSRIAQLVPDIFVRQITRDEDTEIRLPLQKLVEQIGLLRSRHHPGEKSARPSVGTVSLTSLPPEAKSPYPALVMETGEPGRETLRDLLSAVEPVFELKPLENSALNRLPNQEPTIELKPSNEPVIVQFPVTLEAPVVLAPQVLLAEASPSPAPEVTDPRVDTAREIAAPPRVEETPDRVDQKFEEPLPDGGDVGLRIIGEAASSNNETPPAIPSEPVLPVGQSGISVTELVAPTVDRGTVPNETILPLVDLAGAVAETVQPAVASATWVADTVPSVVEPVTSVAETLHPIVEAVAPIVATDVPAIEVVTAAAEPMAPPAESVAFTGEVVPSPIESADPIAEKPGVPQPEPSSTIAEPVLPHSGSVSTIAESLLSSLESAAPVTANAQPPIEPAVSVVPSAVSSLLPTAPGGEPILPPGQSLEPVDRPGIVLNEPGAPSGEQVIPVDQVPVHERPLISKPVIREALDTPDVGGEKIQLSLAAILRQCPREIIVGELPPVPDSVRITLPFAPIDRQLSMGHVEISAVRFVAAVPFSYQKYFSARMGVKVPIPLEEVFQNLPSQATEQPAPVGPPAQILAPAVPEEVEPLAMETGPEIPKEVEVQLIGSAPAVPHGVEWPPLESVPAMSNKPEPVLVESPRAIPQEPERRPIDSAPATLEEEKPSTQGHAGLDPVHSEISHPVGEKSMSPSVPELTPAAESSAPAAPVADLEPIPVPLHLPAFHQFAPPAPVVVSEHVEPASAVMPELSTTLPAHVAAPPSDPGPMEATHEILPPPSVLHAEHVSKPESEAVDSEVNAPGLIPESQGHVSVPDLEFAMPDAVHPATPVMAPPVVAAPTPPPTVAAKPDGAPSVDGEVQPGSTPKEESHAPSMESASSSVVAEGTVTFRPPQMVRPFIVLPPPIIGFTPPVTDENEVGMQATDDNEVESDNTKNTVIESATKTGSDVPLHALSDEPAGAPSEPITPNFPSEAAIQPSEPAGHSAEHTGHPSIISIDFSQALVAPDVPVPSGEAPTVEITDIPPHTPAEPASLEVRAGEAKDGIADIAPIPLESETPPPPAFEAAIPPISLGSAIHPAAEKPMGSPMEAITLVVQGLFVEPLSAPPGPPVSEFDPDAVPEPPPAPEPPPKPVAATPEPVAASLEPAGTAKPGPPRAEEGESVPLLHIPQFAPEFSDTEILPPPALPLRRFDQDALQALFMTEDILDLAKISRLAAQLPGVHACVIATRDQACTGGTLPEGFDLAALLGLAPRVGEAAGRMPIGALKHFTLYGERYSISFFARNSLSLCAVHRPRSFVPGVREKLVAIADELSK